FGRGARCVLDLRRQQPHPAIAQTESRDPAVAAERAGGDRRVGRNRARRRQRGPPLRIAEVELHVVTSGSLRSRASGSRRRGWGGGEAAEGDLLAMLAVVAVREEVRLELQDALEVEGALVEDGVEPVLALLRLVDAGIRVDRLDLRLDLPEVEAKIKSINPYA